MHVARAWWRSALTEDAPGTLRIDDGLSLPRNELVYRASRSSGPGGQHVNKVSTRVTLEFDVAASPSLDEAQRRRLLGRLASRINRAGVMRVHCGRHRSQAANRAEVTERFAALLAEALRRRRPRRRTRPTAASRKRRLSQKRRRSEVKRGRSRSVADDDA